MRTRLLFVLLMLSSLMACTKKGSLTLDRTELTLENQAVRLIAVVTPEQPLTWSSSNEKVAQVYSGYVVPVRNGVAIITVSTTDGKLSAQCTVTVEGHVKDLSENGTANCYIIPEGGRYKFKCTRGNNMDGNISNVHNVRVLWESTFRSDVQTKDLVSDVSYEDGWVYFQTGKESRGNAVIAVSDDLGYVLWSWHLWFCRGYDPVKFQQAYNDGSIWMDRNLGASTDAVAAGFGLMYQWGRKDPFPGPYTNSGSKAPTIPAFPAPSPAKDHTATPGIVTFAHREPMVFLTSSTSSEKWFLSEKEPSEMWNTTKTVNDPCPLGWRVPAATWKNAANGAESATYGRVREYSGTLGFVSDLGSTLAGMQDRMLTYPAAGYYDREGNLTSVKTNVKVWSCSLDGSSARTMTADDVSAKFNSTSSINGAASVRCVKD